MPIAQGKPSPIDLTRRKDASFSFSATSAQTKRVLSRSEVANTGHVILSLLSWRLRGAKCSSGRFSLP